MSVGIQRALRVALLALVASAGGSLSFTVRNGVETDLLALAGDAGGGLKDAASAMSTSARFLVKAESEETAKSRLEALGVPVSVMSSREMSAALKVVAPYARGFLSPSTRRLLEAGEYAAVRDAAVARLYSPMPPALPVDVDPFLLFTDWALDAAAPKGEWVAVNVHLSPDQASAALAAVRGADDVRCAGAPFHAAVASERSKGEVNILSAVSLAFVVLFGWLLVRSFRFVPLLIAVQSAAFCVASAALFAVFGKPHLVTFVFGTSLIGLSVDYVYHSLAAKRPISRPLTLSFLSTAACFLPLMISDVGVMNQMALFTVTGLATVYAAVMLFLRADGGVVGGCGGEASGNEDASAKSIAIRPWLRFAAVAAVAVLPPLAGTLGVRCGVFERRDAVDISRFYRPDPYLAEGERLSAEMSGGSLIPSADEQRRNIRLVAALYAAESDRYRSMTGLPAAAFAIDESCQVFDPKGAIEGLFAGWLRETDRLLLAALAVLAFALVFLFRRECLDFIIPVAVAYSATYGLLVCMGETMNFFTKICFFLFVGLGLDYSVFRWHGASGPAGRAVLYSFLTSFVGFGLLGFTDFAVTRSMGITLAFGLAVSYFSAKMCCGFSREAFRIDAGQVSAGGGRRRVADSPQQWHEQREQCASRFWMQFMWMSYAMFGKTFQRLIFLFAMPFIYLFSVPARTALAAFYRTLSDHSGMEMRPTAWRLFRHILGFAWGLMDKTDACTLRKNLPEMSVRDDDGWRRFKALVDSGKGVFLMCSHVGTVGVLPALPETLRRKGVASVFPKVHAFQQMGHDAIFMKVFMRHFDGTRFEFHAVEDIGVETAVSMQEAIGRGEIVIMAGDRTSAGSGSVLHHRFLGVDCVWPKGVFRFAELMEAPVFAVVCVRTGWNRYDVHMADLMNGEGERPVSRRRCSGAIFENYVKFLEAETIAHPEQWYQFYDFFGAVRSPASRPS